MDFINETVDASDAAIGDDAKNKHAGQLAHRFVHNFQIHEGEQTTCGTCGDEKVCLRCTHVGKRECEVCGIWVSRSYFATHRRIHTGERPFKCAQCLESFSRKDVLVQHMRRHTGEKSFLCDICGLQFRNKHKLVEHQTSVHSSTRKHHCDECDKSYKLRHNLMRHLRQVHHKVYTCRQCGEAVPTRDAFTEHCLIHSGKAKQAEEETEDVKRESSEESENVENGKSETMLE